MQKDKTKLASLMSTESHLQFFIDWDEDGKRLLSPKLVFDLTDVKDLDELSLNDKDET